MIKPYRITATGQIGALRAKKLVGFYVSSTSSGTLVLRDGDEGGTQISGTITPAVGYHSFPCGLRTGLHATVGGTIDVTLFVDE